MASIGELFISLGFQVDDNTLKNFKSNLRDAHEEMNKFAKATSEAVGIASTFLGVFSGFALIVQNSADGVVRLNNMALAFGANADSAQTFANALHQINSQISVNSGQNMYGQFSQLIQGKIPLGQGAAGALALLGGDYHPGQGQTTDEILDNLAKHYDAMKAQLKVGYGVQLEALGLAGAEGLIEQKAHHPELYAAAAKYNNPLEQRETLTAYAHSTAELSEAMTRFENTVSAHLAPAMTQFFNAVTAILNKLPSSDKVGDYLMKERNRRGIMMVNPFVAAYDYLTSHSEEDPIIGSLSPHQNADGVTRGQRNNNLGNIKYGGWAKAHGATGQDSGGFAIFPDVDTGNSAIGALLQNYGNGHRDTISSIVSSYTNGDSPAIQRSYEKMLESTTGRGADEHLNMNDPAVISKLIAGIVQQENGGKAAAPNITITVNSKADAKTVAVQVRQELQNHLNVANAQTNLNN